MAKASDKFCLILNYSKVVWDINTKFSPVVKLYGNPLCTKYEGYRCTKIWISHQNRQKYQMGVAGSIFELHPPNFVRIHIFFSCKNAEIFVMISQLVPDLAKISVSETSISWDVLALLTYIFDRELCSHGALWASLISNRHMKLVLRFDMEKLRFQKIILEFFFQIIFECISINRVNASNFYFFLQNTSIF